MSTMVSDGNIKTACQQACPAEAIVFGNQADPKSDVSKMKAQDRDYSVLGFLDTRPHKTYLAHVRNPNLKVPGPANESGERLEGYYDKPLSAREYDAAAHSDDHPDKKGHEKHGHKEDSKEKPC